MKQLTIAKILKPQGVRGEVKALALTDSPEDLAAFKKVYIGGNAYKVLKVRALAQGYVIIALSGVADRNAAELLRGADIIADRDDAPPLPENTFYIEDMIGCDVVDEKGVSYGKITEIREIDRVRHAIYTLARADGGEITFAAADGVITAVDIEKRTVTVNTARFAEVALGI